MNNEQSHSYLRKDVNKLISRPYINKISIIPVYGFNDSMNAGGAWTSRDWESTPPSPTSFKAWNIYFRLRFGLVDLPNTY